ncbi:MAG: tagaturonate reductase [Saprospiraceae bacterium]|nr:tagaturonate reductase [Saprospiraceae bacterium]
MNQLSTRLLTGRPESALLTLPEKVLQFGTGALLRGLPDYLIDRANKQGIFNGRVVVVKSTDAGDSGIFEQQDNLYTLLIRGIENGKTVSENIISSAISRVLSARQQWPEVLACAANPLLEIVLSNTTEVGIQLVQEDIRQMPPSSFPGKLLAFLHARYRVFHGDLSKGLVIVPTELVTGNGDLLESIVLELAHENNLEYGFIEWLENACTFCNSLVDRIVPGQPSANQIASLQAELGYEDQLITVAEPYCLWAIEGDEKVANVLSFQQAAPESVVITTDINGYRERKLRLLNGTHTLSCGLAHLAGFTTVNAAMEDLEMASFITHLVLQEIAPAIPYSLPPGDAEQFGRQVLERFRNPAVEHRWLSITVQYSAKMRMRNIAVLLEHYRKNQTPPRYFALGFAAFLCFYRQADCPIKDDQAAYFIEKWETLSAKDLTHTVLADKELWGADLSLLPGFEAQVQGFVAGILNSGARTVLHEFLSKDETKSFANTPA